MVTGPRSPGGPPHWPALPSGRPPSGWEKLLQALRVIRRRRLITGKRIGCALVILVMAVVAALFAVSKMIDAISDVFTDDPEPVAGSPFDTVAPTATTPQDPRPVNRPGGYVLVTFQEFPGLLDWDPKTRTATGMEYRLLEMIAQDLGIENEDITLKPSTGPGYVPELLASRQSDVVIGGFEITAKRRGEMAFAGPVFTGELGLLVRSGSTVTGLDNLGDNKICAIRGSTGEEIAAPVVGDRLEARDNMRDCLNAGAPAVVADVRLLQAAVADKPDRYRIVGPPLGDVAYGFAIAPKETEFRDRAQAALRTIVADGRWAQLYSEFFGGPPATLPTIGP